MNKHPIEQAVEIAGSQANLARLIGRTSAYVWKMLRTQNIPLEQCLPIEIATGGKVTRAQLRPDVFGESVTRKKPSK
jgi:DNA-binding transcriptional regulator YdaS (Cro superfamily)